MKRLLFLLSSLLLFVSLNAYTVSWQENVTNYHNAYTKAIAVDSLGNLFATGFQSDGISEYNFATVRVSPTGSVLWEKYFISNNSHDEHANGIALDGEDNVIVAGNGYRSAGHIFLTAKYDSSGNLLWTDSIGSVNDNTAEDVVTDGSGNIYVAGYISPSDTLHNAFIVKYDSIGNVIWQDTLIDTINSRINGIAYSDSGYLYAIGTIYGDTSNSIFLASINSDGSLRWNFKIADGSDSRRVAADEFGNAVIIYNNASYSFIRKFSPSGNEIRTDSVSNVTGSDVCVSGSGYVYFVGTINSSSPTCLYAIKMDSIFNILWEDTTSVNGNGAIGVGIGTDEYDDIYVLSSVDISVPTYYIIKYIPSIDFGVSRIVSPSASVYAGYIHPSAEVVNFGEFADSNFNVIETVYDTTSGFSLVDTTSVSYLSKYDSTTVSFDSLLVEANHAYKITVYTDLADGHSSNDTSFVYTNVEPSVDVGVDTILSPCPGFNDSGVVVVKGRFFNYGSSTYSFEVYATVTDSVTGDLMFLDSSFVSNLFPSDSTDVSFGSVEFVLGHTYKTMVYTANTDTNASNDTVTVYSNARHFKVLYVEDAEGYGAPYHPDPVWYMPLENIVGDSNLYWFGPTDSASENGPSLQLMKTADLIIWNTYDYYDEQCFTDRDTVNLNDYMLNGGKVWLIGQDIVYSMYDKRGSKREMRGATSVPWLSEYFGVDSVYEDFIYDSTMTIEGVGPVSGPPIAIHSDFDTNYDGDLYPDEIFYDSMDTPVLIEPDSNFVIGVVSKDSTRAVWTTACRGVNVSTDSSWTTLVKGMLRIFGIGEEGINAKTVSVPDIKKYSITGRTVNHFVDFMYKGPTRGDIMINDISGRLVKEYHGVKSGTGVRLNVGAGVYFVRIKGTNVTKKISVIK